MSVNPSSPPASGATRPISPIPSVPALPSCIEIVPGNLYLAAPSNGLAELKLNLQRHILQHRAQQAATPKAGRRIHISAKESPGPTSPSPVPSASSPESSRSSLLGVPNTNNGSLSTTPTLSGDEQVQRAPEHGSHQLAPAPPGTPGFHVKLAPLASPATPADAAYQDKKLSIKLLSIDGQFHYTPIAHDFGPFCLSQIVRFVRGVAALLRQPDVDAVVCYCGQSPSQRLNAALLMGALMVLHLNRSAEMSEAAVTEFCGRQTKFRDASAQEEQFDITLLDCLRAFSQAVSVKLFSLSTFNLNEFEYYSSFENGDISVVVPGKLLAFSGPSDHDPAVRFSPTHYCDVFKALGVSLVIRLNFPEYNAQPFFDAGIRHVDMYFPDGCAPSIGLAAHFLELVDRSPGLVAIHCRAGLGRTGTCIAMYLMKHGDFGAAEATAWVRMCRPGSIVGLQYSFLCRMQSALNEERRNDAILAAAAQRERANALQALAQSAKADAPANP